MTSSKNRAETLKQSCQKLKVFLLCRGEQVENTLKQSCQVESFLLCRGEQVDNSLGGCDHLRPPGDRHGSSTQVSSFYFALVFKHRDLLSRYEKIKGLPEAFDTPGVGSNYRY